MKVILIFALLLIIIQGTQKVVPLSSVLAEIQDIDFGKSVSALIQLTIHSEQPTDRLNAISDLLSELKAVADEQNRIAQEQIFNTRAFCSEQITTLTSQIFDQQAKLSDAEKELSDLKQELLDKQGNLEDEENNYNELQLDLETTTNDLIFENEDFARKFQDYSDLLIAIEEGINLLNRMIHGQEHYDVKNRQGSMFLEVRNFRKGMQKKMNQFQQHSSSPLLEPVISILTSIQSKSQINFEDMMNCINLLFELKNQLEQNKILLEMRHKEIVEHLEGYIGDLHKWIEGSARLIEIYKDRIDEILNRIKELEEIIADTTKLLETNQQFLKDTNTQCDEEESKYAQEQLVRNRQIAILEKLINYFNLEVNPAASHVGALSLSQQNL